MKKFLSLPIFDPKNPIWLEILRLTVLGVTALILLTGIMGSMSMLLRGQLMFFERFILMILGLMGTALSAGLTFVIGMISLNALYNLQQIRINTDKQ